VSLASSITAEARRHVTLTTAKWPAWAVMPSGSAVADGLPRQHCLIHDMAAGGVRIGQVHDTSFKSDTTGHCIVDNNIIRSGGVSIVARVGVWIGQRHTTRSRTTTIADSLTRAFRPAGLGLCIERAHHNKIDFITSIIFGWVC